MPKAVRFILKLLSAVIALGLAASVLILGGAAYFNAPPAENYSSFGFLSEKPSAHYDDGIRLEDGALFLEVRNGETAFSVGTRLESTGIIRNRYFWYLLFRLDKEYMKTGTYRIELPASQMRIRSILTTGDQLLVKVTIPEGVTLKKTARTLEDAGICEAEDFLRAASSREILDAYKVPGATMEGYLYPDTYLFPLGYPVPKVISTMADTFFQRLEEIESKIRTPQGGQPTKSMSAAELNRRVIIASIIEREYRVPEEAALMAGVFYNRLKIGMALQSCATVEYVITEIENRPHPDMLYSRDLEIRSPYNTYIRPGLPPGPISTPGETALKAAFAPASTDYFYFRLIDLNSGRHYFSRTLDDHIRAGALYVKGK
jgi:UPF0755 protein